MKRFLILVVGVLFLVACANTNTNEEVPEPVQVEEDEEVIVEDDPVVESQDSEEVSSSEDNSEESSTATNNHLQDFTEYNVVAETIDLTKYTGEIQTDNQGTRVIIYEDENRHKEYKSVFVKRDNRLKIIRFSDDGMLYNERLN